MLQMLQSKLLVHLEVRMKRTYVVGRSGANRCVRARYPLDMCKNS
jgi:hypothetical protein